MIQAREIRSASLGAAIIAVYASFVLMSGLVDLSQFRSLLTFYLGGSFLLWGALGFVGLIVQLLRASRNTGRGPFLTKYVGDAVRARWERDRFVSLFWPPLLFAILIASFNAFKQMVLPSAGFTFDPLLRHADRLLFLGHDPWTVTHSLLGSPDVTLAIDRIYHGWFLPMCIGLIVCAWLPERTYRLRTQYILSYIAVWVLIGTMLAYLMPSAGPIFYSRFVGPDASFDALLSKLHGVEAATGSHVLALTSRDMLLRAHDSGQLMIGSGISAMPSVHNALAALFAMAAFKLNRTAGWLLTFYAAFIWIGSIHLGWHYAFDGIVAILLTFGIWHVCGRIADRLEHPLFGAETRPAIA